MEAGPGFQAGQRKNVREFLELEMRPGGLWRFQEVSLFVEKSESRDPVRVSWQHQGWAQLRVEMADF